MSNPRYAASQASTRIGGLTSGFNTSKGFFKNQAAQHPDESAYVRFLEKNADKKRKEPYTAAELQDLL